MRRQGRHHKADDHADSSRGSNPQPQGGTQGIIEEGHKGRQTGGEQPDDDILVPLFLLIAGEEPVAEQDGQAVHQIFAEQRKSTHDENGSHAQTAVSESQPAGEQQGSQGHQSGIEHGSAHAADDKVVGDEHIRRAVDRRQTGQQGVPGGEHQSADEQKDRKCQHHAPEQL